jgi:tetratricopeptide (TPR) repeat protein
VAKRNGEYKLQVYPLGKLDQSGDYTITLTDLRETRIGDQSRIAAEQNVSIGEEFRDQGSAVCLEAALDKFNTAKLEWKGLERPAKRAGQAKLLDLRYEQAAVAYGQGLAHRTQGNYAKAIEDFTLSLSLARESNRYMVGVAQMGLAWAYQMSGNTDQAIKNFKEALEVRNWRNAGGFGAEVSCVGKATSFPASDEVFRGCIASAKEIRRLSRPSYRAKWNRQVVSSTGKRGRGYQHTRRGI